MKRGGSKMGYTEQFNLLSPCYKEGEARDGFHAGGAKATKKEKKATTKAKKPSTTKKVKKGKSSKQRGGSSCGASPSVSEMGVIDTPPASLQKSESQDAFLERYSNNIMKGGANGNTQTTNTNTNNLLKLNSKPVKNSTNNLLKLNSEPVKNSTNNSPLNKSKNVILPKETISGLVMKLIKTEKNPTNSTNDKFSYEIYYKIEGSDEIKKLVLLNVGFSEFLKEYRIISDQVFPRPPKRNGPNAVPKLNGPNAVPKPNNVSKNAVPKPNNLFKNPE